MDAGHLPGYFSISLVMEERRLPNNFPDGHIHGCRHEHHPPTNSAQNNDNAPVSNDGDQCLEDAQLILGRDVTFTIIGDDDTFDARKVVENLASAHTNAANPGTALLIPVPRNKLASFREALGEHLVRRSQQVIERAGQTSFWRGREPFMRPTLSRSLSLP